MTFLIVMSIPLVAAQQTPSPPSPKPTKQQEGVPVVFNEDTLFTIKERFGGYSPETRVEVITQRLQDYAKDYTLPVNDLKIVSEKIENIPLSVITGDNIEIVTITNRDAQAAEYARDELAQIYLQKIKKAISHYREERSTGNLIRGVIFTIVTTIILLISLFIINNIFTKIYQRLKAWGNTHIRPVYIGTFELIRANQLDNILIFVTQVTQALIIVGLFVIYFPLIFSQFFWTQGWAVIFWNSIFQTLETGWNAFSNYLPNLLTIILVTTITYIILRFSKPFFHELSQGAFHLPNFYPEWALPTYRLITFLIIALATIIVFPLLPGFNSPAFQGISVFLGILFSLGSTSIVANVVSGTILIYTRAFRVGDPIKIDDKFGQVIETTLLVTRLLTPTNEVISIPNSEIITSSIMNLNFATKELDKPYIVRTTVYLGYEVPWRKAYEALMEAALKMDGVADFPAPFVLQGELNDVYVTYSLNVYVNQDYFKDKTATDLEKTRSKLHENIRDCCQQAEIRIFAPSYEADPTAYGPAAESFVLPSGENN